MHPTTSYLSNDSARTSYGGQQTYYTRYEWSEGFSAGSGLRKGSSLIPASQQGWKTLPKIRLFQYTYLTLATYISFFTIHNLYNSIYTSLTLYDPRTYQPLLHRESGATALSEINAHDMTWFQRSRVISRRISIIWPYKDESWFLW